MLNEIRKLTTRFQDSLQRLSHSHQQLDKALKRLFEALGAKGVRTNMDANTLLNDAAQANLSVQETSVAIISLLEQSFELARTSALISSSLDINQVVNDVMDTIIHLTNAERAYLMLRTEAGGPMDIVAARTSERSDLSLEDVIFSQSVVDLAIEKQKPIITADALDDTRFRSKTSIVGNSLRSILCIPLVLREEVIGVLYSDNPIQKSIFRQEHLPILIAFAQQTAVAIENARLYQDLEQANRHLNEANRLKSEFLGVISHELRSPFAPIGFALQIFPKYGMDHLKPEQREVWQDLGKHIEHAQHLVNNLVNFAGLLSKQGQLNLTQVNITQLIEDAATDARRMAESRQVNLILELPDELILPSGDQERISEAVWHLLQNAIQYNKPGGQVIVRASKTRDTLSIEVEDTGQGIPVENQAKIWEAFQQLTDSLKRGVEGLGLGLALVKYVALAHGGSVSLESEPGVGSKFTLVLPASSTHITETF